MPNTKDETRGRVKRRVRKVREFVSKIFKGKKTAELAPLSLSSHKLPTEEGKTSKTNLTSEQQKELNEQFRIAAANGKIEDVRRLALLGADINSKDENGWTALHQAAANGHTETCRVLKELEADINAEDNSGRTALHYAARWGSPETCRVLVNEFGADINAKDTGGETALHWAAWNTHPETCRVLFELGANPLIKDEDGKTARDFSDFTGNPEIKKLLKECEIFWFGKLIGKEKVNNILEAVKECNSETIREIFINL